MIIQPRSISGHSLNIVGVSSFDVRLYLFIFFRKCLKFVCPSGCTVLYVSFDYVPLYNLFTSSLTPTIVPAASFPQVYLASCGLSLIAPHLSLLRSSQFLPQSLRNPFDSHRGASQDGYPGPIDNESQFSDTFYKTLQKVFMRSNSHHSQQRPPQ